MEKIKLKDLHNNPNHSGEYNQEQIERLVSSIRITGLMRPFPEEKHQ